MLEKISVSKRNVIYNMTGTVTYQACNWLIISVIAKLMNAEAVGLYALSFAITAPVFMMSGMQLRNILVTDIKCQIPFSDYLGFRIITCCCAIVVVIMIVLYKGFTISTETMIVVLIAFSKAIEALADIFHGIYQKNEKMEYTAIANIIKGIFSILFLFVGIYFFHSLLIGIILYTLSWGMIFVFYELRISKRFEKIKVSFNRDSIFKLAREGLPMGIISGLGSLRANIPRYFIALDFGLREVGIFSALSYIMIVGSLLIMALTTSLLPRFAKYYSDKSCTNFFALAKKALVVSISLGILGIIISLVIGKQVLVILYSAEYAEYSTVFVLIAIASAITFSTSMLTAMITSARLFSSQLPVSFIELVSIVLFSLYFVPKLGMYGAGLALIMSSAVHLICKSLMLASVLKKMKNPIN